MNRTLVAGAAGALAMYFLDPRSGRRRRARLRDRMTHAARVLGEAGKVTARDTRHRALGVIASANRLLRNEPVSDEALVERVRAALGRAVSHSHALQVGANSGHVTLSGPILAYEVRGLLACVRKVPGVRAVSDQLQVHENAEHVSALQGGVPRSGARFELLQENWSPAARLATGTVGTGLILAAARSHGLWGAVLGVAGGGLLARAATNLDLLSLFGIGEHGITVQKVIHVDAPPEVVYAFWTDYQNFPRFMHNVREVREVSEGRSRWEVAGPAGVPVRWTAEVTRLVPNSLIEWHCDGESDVRHEGSVRFEPVGAGGEGGTRVNVRLSYVPPGGAFGHAVATAFGADPKAEMDDDLMRMKVMIETGRAPRDAARPLHRES